MKENWTYKKFEDCLDKVKYTSKVPSSDYLKDGLFPIVSQEEGLISGYWDEEGDVFKVQKPVVIFGDHTRILKYVDFDFVLGADGVKILQPIDGLSAKFLLYYLTWCNIPSLGYSRHYKLLKELDTPVPPIETQSRIVSELDLLQSIIDKQQAQLKELDKLAQSVFYDMFGDPVENEKGWEVKKLEEIVAEDCPISYGIVQPGEGVANGVPVVRPVDMTNTFVFRFGLKQTTKEISDSYRRTILKGNEILLCVRGTTGLVALASEELVGCNVTRGVAPIECNEHNDRWFVFYQFLTKGIQQYIADFTKGIALKQINMKDVREIPFIVPPLSLQQTFATKIESIEKQKSAISQSITETQKLFDYTMDKYFG